MSVVNAGRLPKQYFYILGHSNPGLLCGYKKNNAYNYMYEKSKAADLWRLLKDIQGKGYKDGQTIVFLSCQIGNKTNSFAEAFSKLEGVGTVYGFTALGWFGLPFYTAAQFKGIDETKHKSYSAKRVYGHWRIFNTAAAAKIKNPATKPPTKK